MNQVKSARSEVKAPRLPKDLGLPVFPWDTLAPFKKQALAHPQGLVDLSVGTPVDDTPLAVQQALQAAANSPGYPTVYGAVELREAIAKWCQEIRGSKVVTAKNCFPTVGSKELVANLGWQLGLGKEDKILFPEVAYPTYDICARLCGAEGIAVGHDYTQWPTDATLVWINTPGNPDGWVADEEWLAQVIVWAWENDVVLASDECYAQLGWDLPLGQEITPSILTDSVLDKAQSLATQRWRNPAQAAQKAAGADRLLMVYSMSKQSNLAGYRASFVAGDQQLIMALVGVRKHAGFMVPMPNQQALQAALNAQNDALEQRERYRQRRVKLLAACEKSGLVNHPDSRAGLYLWMTLGRGALAVETQNFSQTTVTPAQSVINKATSADHSLDWQLVEKFSELGILVAPGEFYGPAAAGYVRIALSASDEKIASACERLSNYYF